MNKRIVRYVVVFFLSTSVSAESTKHVQTDLKALEKKIHRLQHHLTDDHETHHRLHQTLTQAEQRLAKLEKERQQLQKQEQEQTQALHDLEQQLQSTVAQHHALQTQLNHYVQARYRQQTPTWLRWLMHPETAHTLHRNRMYHHYLMQTTQTLLQRTQTTQALLQQQQQTLEAARDALHVTQQACQQHMQTLSTEKHTYAQRIHALDEDIHLNEQTLLTYQHNQRRLTSLLTSLAQKSVLQTHYPLTRMRQKLPYPLHTLSTPPQKRNQGLLFYAPEGTPVYAIYPGKVVFSNWLNGYGFLLIVDHGWGFMSLYAHNQSLLKHKGDLVTSGEQLARVGRDSALEKSGLYFELRHRGKPISPLEWLSTRSV